jgi:glycosyltransferase involved in cell wall biosynthesis
MTTPRVLSLINGLSPTLGGPPEVCANSCIAAQRAGVESTLLVGAPGDGSEAEISPALRRLADEGVRVEEFELFPRASPRSRRWGVSPPVVRWLSRHLHQYDLLHLHGTWGFIQVAGLLAAKRADRPCVMSPHEGLTYFDIEKPGSAFRPIAKQALKRIYLRELALIVFSSQLEAQGSIPIPMPGYAKAAVIPHPLRDALEMSPSEAPPENGPLEIGFLGRLHPKKNLDVLIRAVRSASHEAKIIVAGEGPHDYTAQLKSLATELGMQDRVEWLGFVGGNAKWQFLDRLAVLAMPSSYECFGMSAAEAMGRGTATIVSQNTGIAEIANRHNCGIVAAPTVSAFADAITTLDSDRSKLAQLAAAGPPVAHQELSLQTHGNTLRDHYEHILQGPRL